VNLKLNNTGAVSVKNHNLFSPVVSQVVSPNSGTSAAAQRRA